MNLEEQHELEVVLDALKERGIRFRVPTGTARLQASGKLTDEEKAIINRHRETLVQIIQDDELEKTGIIQCVRQVFELAHGPGAYACIFEAADDRCDDCFGSGVEPDRPGHSCISCGGSGTQAARSLRYEIGSGRGEINEEGQPR